MAIEDLMRMWRNINKPRLNDFEMSLFIIAIISPLKRSKTENNEIPTKCRRLVEMAHFDVSHPNTEIFTSLNCPQKVLGQFISQLQIRVNKSVI